MGIIEGVLAGSLPFRNPNAQVFSGINTMALLNAAISAAVAGNGDIILLDRGGISVTSTIAFNKSGLHVISVDDGQSPFARGEFNAIYAGAGFTDGPAATITAPTYFQGVGFASRDTGATFWSGAAALIGGDADANPWGVWMKNCRFPKWGLDNRIGLAIEGSSNCLIDECDFEGVTTALESGIYVQGATQNLVVRGCHFRQCTSAITHGAFAGGGPHCIYHGNWVEDGLLLTTGSNSATGMITGNYVETTDGLTYDLAARGDIVTLGLNTSGNHYLETWTN